MPEVARTSTHLFQFAEALQGFGGWGRATTRAVAGWYERDRVGQLAYQAIKYRQREGCSVGVFCPVRLTNPANRGLPWVSHAAPPPLS